MNASPTELATAKAKLIKFCRQFGALGASRTNLSYHSHTFGLQTDDRNNLIKQMVAAGELVEYRDRFFGQPRPSVRYATADQVAAMAAENAA